MEKIYTFLLVFFIGLGCYSQQSTSLHPKTGTFSDKITVDAQSFTIEKVYPNPVKDLLTVDLNVGVAGEIQVSLINILGSEVKKWDGLALSQGDQKIKLDLSQFRSGMYILKIVKQDQVRTQVLKKN